MASMIAISSPCRYTACEFGGQATSDEGNRTLQEARLPSRAMARDERFRHKSIGEESARNKHAHERLSEDARLTRVQDSKDRQELREAKRGVALPFIQASDDLKGKVSVLREEGGGVTSWGHRRLS
eukprot:4510903-Pleurochrysis_carterae.AAC.4